MSRAGRRTVTDPTPPIIPGRTPDPPPELNAAQKAIWTSIVGRLPVGWFSGENLPMMKELARHIEFQLARRRYRAGAGCGRRS
jgi:hypothetical protein